MKNAPTEKHDYSHYSKNKRKMTTDFIKTAKYIGMP